jgi:hypothetical protein
MAMTFAVRSLVLVLGVLLIAPTVGRAAGRDKAPPALSRIVAKLKGTRPLRGYNVLWVSRLGPGDVALSEAFRSAGLRPLRTVVVEAEGQSGPNHRGVGDHLVERGMDVRTGPRLGTAIVERWRADALADAGLRDIVGHHRRDGRPILVVDHGGTVAKLLAQPKYAAVRSAVTIIDPAATSPAAGHKDASLVRELIRAAGAEPPPR